MAKDDFEKIKARVDAGKGTEAEYTIVKLTRDKALGDGTGTVSGLGPNNLDWLSDIKLGG